MNELNTWIAEHEPLSPKLNDLEIQTLQRRVMERKHTRLPKVRLALALAAAICLLGACGSAVLGLFDSMTDSNQTRALVEDYSLTLEDPPSVFVDGRTVTVHAVIRSEEMARVIFDVTGTKKQTRNFLTFKNADGIAIFRYQLLNEAQTEQMDSLSEEQLARLNQIRQLGPIGALPEQKSIRYFADMDIPEDSETVCFRVQSQDGGAQEISIPLPEAIPERRISLEPPVCLKDRDGQKEIGELTAIRISPFRLTLEGHRDASLTGEEFLKLDMNGLVRLYDTDGTEIKPGRDGSFYAASGSVGEEDDRSFLIELDSYDLMDPAKISEVQINGDAYPVEGIH